MENVVKIMVNHGKKFKKKVFPTFLTFFFAVRPKRKYLLFVLSDLPAQNTPGLECFFDPAGLECFSDVLVRSGNVFFLSHYDFTGGE